MEITGRDHIQWFETARIKADCERQTISHHITNPSIDLISLHKYFYNLFLYTTTLHVMAPLPSIAQRTFHELRIQKGQTMLTGRAIHIDFYGVLVFTPLPSPSTQPYRPPWPRFQSIRR